MIRIASQPKPATPRWHRQPAVGQRQHRRHDVARMKLRITVLQPQGVAHLVLQHRQEIDPSGRRTGRNRPQIAGRKRQEFFIAGRRRATL